MSDLKTIRWGIIGSGMISEWFVQDISLNHTKNYKHIITAIGTSSTAKGENLISKFIKFNHGIKPKVQSYNETYIDDEVDVIYIGLPHSMHFKACLKAIEAGKHVLCEKPLVINCKEAVELYSIAESKQLFIMEGMWTKFFPIIHDLRLKLFDDKVIGVLKTIKVDFKSDLKLDTLGDESRLINPKFGAGTLLDMGVYALTYSRILMSKEYENEKEKDFEISHIEAIVKNGIDHKIKFQIHYKKNDNKVAFLDASSIEVVSTQICEIEGTLGKIKLYLDPTKFPNPARPFKYEIIIDDVVKETIEFDHPGRGFYYEADYVADIITNSNGTGTGDLQPLKHSHQENIFIMKLMDEIRDKIGVKYPQDD
ncbi:hypothetical protein CANARDRAFT_30446 [[Candida] arabinofermentans NRRL YB-2248]|uniref:D-xylose 1-dehydrogenase (NADP(+), D-xylono-1,5-lactone-forming) n=1 Tax=[Candida] arabinofermentans NRRL YB-2248 TaxID=983967 RepID=A0A1E4STZ6_9ASCO|nr:hypothetical protein CANARDRAFT_30446 [[Candida] arabinofermentans NRRL YB-2248]